MDVTRRVSDWARIHSALLASALPKVIVIISCVFSPFYNNIIMVTRKSLGIRSLVFVEPDFSQLRPKFIVLNILTPQDLSIININLRK